MNPAHVVVAKNINSAMGKILKKLIRIINDKPPSKDGGLSFIAFFAEKVKENLKFDIYNKIVWQQKKR